MTTSKNMAMQEDVGGSSGAAVLHHESSKEHEEHANASTSSPSLQLGDILDRARGGSKVVARG